MAGKGTPPVNRKSVRQVLKAWHRAAVLGDHPLAQLRVVASQRQESGYANSASGRGTALRHVLREALSKIKPAEGEPPDNTHRGWRFYLVLYKQYIQNCSPDEVAEELGVARSTYHHIQAAALDTLADILWEMEQCHAADADPQPAGDQKPPVFLAPPGPPYALVGREAVTTSLKERLFARESQALVGLPGVGKSALAIALAHDEEVFSRFPDGLLWAALGQDANLASVLDLWATALDISPKTMDQSGGIEALSQAIHIAIGLRRMLLIIDDAWNAEAALTFRLGGPNCAHLVTTRLREVAVRFAGSRSMRVQELREEDSMALLAQVAPHLVKTAPQAARELVQLVGGLPLGLVLLGTFLHIESHRHPVDYLPTVLERLRQPEERLAISQLSGSLDRHPSLPPKRPLSLKTVIEISIQAMDEPSRRALRALSALPTKPGTFSLAEAQSATAVTIEALSALLNHNLLAQNEAGRYALHPVVADFARTWLKE
ncbi:MAG: NB-ARC domain-containing protein [Chloroflexota bacterium]